jgi:hypothetical protein
VFGASQRRHRISDIRIDDSAVSPRSGVRDTDAEAAFIPVEPAPPRALGVGERVMAPTMAEFERATLKR